MIFADMDYEEKNLFPNNVNLKEGRVLMKNVKIFIQIIVIQFISITLAQSDPVSVTYDYTGSEQTFTVPSGASSIQIETWGAQGGGGEPCSGSIEDDGGLGGYTIGTLAVTPGEVLNIFVGEKPTTVNGGSGPGGFNGGGDHGRYAGAGGGASDVRRGGITLADRIIVAGGGGGGNAGCPDHGSGGAGGGLTGDTGLTGGNSFVAGGGGTASSGGAGGGDGSDGALGVGGTGGYHVAGGGGGYYGGGGAYAAGGGGGSSYFGGVTNGSTQSGVRTGNGQVIITYTTLPDPITSVLINGTSGYRMLSSPVSGTVYGDLLYELWTQGMAGSDDPDIGGANVWTFFNNEWGGWWNPLIDLTTDDYTAGSGVLVYVYADTDFDGEDDLPVTLSVGNASATLVFSDGASASYALHNELHTDEENGSIYYEIESGTLTLSDGVTIINVDGGGYCRTHGAGKLLWDGGMLTSDVYDENCNSYSFDVMNPSEDMNTIFSNGGSAEFADGSYYNAWEGSGSSTATIILDAIEADDYDSDISISTIESSWNLLGNPYPWAVDISQLGADNPNYNSTVYIWDNATSAYRIHNGQTGDITDGLISPFQGFWIYSNSGTNFTFTEASLSGNTGTNYRTTTDDSNGSAVFTFTNGGYSSSTYLSFTPEGHINLDPVDANRIVPLSPAEHLTSMIHESGKSLSINNLPLELSNDISFPMDVMMLSPTEDGYETMAEQVNLTWDITNLPAGMTLELKNNITGQNINLTGYPSAYINLPSKGGFLMSEDFLATYPVVGDAYFTVSVNVTLAGQGDDDIFLPEQLVLHNAYPNPFNPSTLIRFDLLDANMVSLDIFDLNGKQVSSLISEYMIPGSHQISWNPGNLPSGVYIAKLSTGNTSLNQKITYIK